MPKIAYIEKRFNARSRAIIDTANIILNDYAAQGFSLTLRQLYYQFVARGIIPNRMNEYKKLGSIVNDARLAGLIDWNHIEDRTRNLEQLAKWRDPSHAVESLAGQFHIDLWKDQTYRVEVWIEKDALAGVIEPVCDEFDVPFLSCRGYTSQSEMWGAAQRLLRYERSNQTPLILHLGDHDPSGKDMTRDIFDRLEMFMGGVEVKRLALNWDQIEQYSPPPNPAKITDSRAAGYIAEFGRESWELDALEPTVIDRLIRDAVESVIDWDEWTDALEQRRQWKNHLEEVSRRWDEVEEMIG